jgi:hypothetical protein
MKLQKENIVVGVKQMANFHKRVEEETSQRDCLLEQRRMFGEFLLKWILFRFFKINLPKNDKRNRGHMTLHVDFCRFIICDFNGNFERYPTVRVHIFSERQNILAKSNGIPVFAVQTDNVGTAFQNHLFQLLHILGFQPGVFVCLECLSSFRKVNESLIVEDHA